MPRPCCPRRIGAGPPAAVFKPAGIPLRDLEPVVMSLDEFEALRLADLEGFYQEAAAERMGVSRATFGRILDAAHARVADALVHGKALRIEGGPVTQVRRGCCHVHGTRSIGPAHARETAREQEGEAPR